MGKTQIYGSITEVRPLAVVHLNTTFDHSIYLMNIVCIWLLFPGPSQNSWWMWLNLQHFPQSKKSLKRLTLKHPFVDQHWSFQHTIAKIPSVPNEKEIDSCLTDAPDRVKKPLGKKQSSGNLLWDWLEHGIQNHLYIPTKCLRLRLLPSATALGSCWRSVLGISIKTVPKSKRQQKVASMNKRDVSSSSHPCCQGLPRASRHCKKYTDSEIPVTTNVSSFWEDSMPKQPSKGLDLQLLLWFTQKNHMSL